MENPKLNIELLSRKSRNTAWMSVAGFIIIAASLIYSYVNLNDYKSKRDQLQNEVAGLEQRRNELAKERDMLAQEIDVTRRNLDFAQNSLNAISFKNPAIIKKAVEDAVVMDPKAARSVSRIFIQIPEEEQRPRVKEIQKVLQDRGYLVPGIERRKEIVPNSVVRYFHPEDVEKAKDIAGILRSQGIEDVQFQFIKAYETKVRPGQYEIWFSRGPLGKPI